MDKSSYYFGVCLGFGASFVMALFNDVNTCMLMGTLVGAILFGIIALRSE